MEKDWANISWKLGQPITALPLGGREIAALIENRIYCGAQIYIKGQDALLDLPKMGTVAIRHINEALEQAGFRALEKGASAFQAAPQAPDLLDGLPPHQKIQPKYWNHVFEAESFLEFQKTLDAYLSTPHAAFHLQLAADPKGFYNLQVQALSQDPAMPPEQPAIARIFNDPEMQEIIRRQAENPANPDRPGAGVLGDPDAAEIMRRAMGPKTPKNG